MQDPLSWNLDSTRWIPGLRYWIPDSVPLEPGTRVTIVSGIPDSTSIKFPGLPYMERYSSYMQLWLPRVWGNIASMLQAFFSPLIFPAHLTLHPPHYQSANSAVQAKVWFSPFWSHLSTIYRVRTLFSFSHSITFHDFSMTFSSFPWPLD